MVKNCKLVYNYLDRKIGLLDRNGLLSPVYLKSIIGLIDQSRYQLGKEMKQSLLEQLSEILKHTYKIC
jgi:hypothetical protein